MCCFIANNKKSICLLYFIGMLLLFPYFCRSDNNANTEKKIKRVVFPLLALLCACSEPKESTELVQFDSLADYPEKHFVLEDIADVSYIFLDDQGNDDFLFDGTPIAITNQTAVFARFAAGDLHLFDTSGKPISYFNHKGSGPGDYNGFLCAFVDEKRDELFLIDKNIIHVYDKMGNHKRNLKLPKDTYLYEAIEYDEESILLMDFYLYVSRNHPNVVEKNGDRYDSPYIRISKTDGSIMEYIPVPYDYSISLSVPFRMGNMEASVVGSFHFVLPHREGALLNSPQLDTLFVYNGKELTPAWLHTPPVKEMETKSYINGYVETSGYQFFEKTLLKVDKTPRPPEFHYVYDTKEKQFYQPKITLKEFPDKEIHLNTMMLKRTADPKLGFVMLPAHELKEAEANNQLSGKLKEIVAGMAEDDNDLLLMIRFR